MYRLYHVGKIHISSVRIYEVNLGRTNLYTLFCLFSCFLSAGSLFCKSRRPCKHLLPQLHVVFTFILLLVSFFCFFFFFALEKFLCSVKSSETHKTALVTSIYITNSIACVLYILWCFNILLTQ